jgi:hypothetical protein
MARGAMALRRHPLTNPSLQVASQGRLRLAGEMKRLRPLNEASIAGNRKGSSTIRVTLLLLVPVAPVAAYGFNLAPIWIFLAGISGIAILAEWIRVATEQLALHVGPTVGGLLTVSLGSLAELMLALFVLASRVKSRP